MRFDWSSSSLLHRNDHAARPGEVCARRWSRGGRLPADRSARVPGCRPAGGRRSAEAAGSGPHPVPNVTLLDLVSTGAEHARSDDEVIATVVYMVNGGDVCLCG